MNIIEELRAVQNKVQSTPISDFEELAGLLERRAELINVLEPNPESLALLRTIAEQTRQMQIRIQAERRRLCLDAAELRSRQRLLETMQGVS
jgi:hypothetical protein